MRTIERFCPDCKVVCRTDKHKCMQGNDLCCSNCGQVLLTEDQVAMARELVFAEEQVLRLRNKEQHVGLDESEMESLFDYEGTLESVEAERNYLNGEGRL